MDIAATQANDGTWAVFIKLDNGDQVFHMEGIPNELVAAKQVNKLRNAMGRLLKEHDNKRAANDVIQVWYKPEGKAPMNLVGRYDTVDEALKGARFDMIRMGRVRSRYQWVRTGDMVAMGL